MNKKNIAKALKAKMKDWLDSIDDQEVIMAIKKDAMITGGAIVSMLNGEQPNDYDIYFRTFESCLLVSKYYANRWNKDHPEKYQVSVGITGTELDDRFAGEYNEDLQDKRVILTIGPGRGIGMTQIDDPSEPELIDDVDEGLVEETEEEQKVKKPKYRPRYMTTNAITLTNDIQIVIRFTGDVDKIHENYDFEHCKCSFDYHSGEVNLPNKALECIINKELFYSGSKYPLCSIIRTRKFLKRGWTINAGQYVKMALELNELNLKDIRVFKEQLVGVDSAYFSAAIEAVEKKMEGDPAFQPDNSYLFEIINRIF